MRLEAIIFRHISQGLSSIAMFAQGGVTDIVEQYISSRGNSRKPQIRVDPQVAVRCWSEAQAVLEESLQRDPLALKSYEALFELLQKPPGCSAEELVVDSK